MENLPERMSPGKAAGEKNSGHYSTKKESRSFGNNSKGHSTSAAQVA